MQSLREVASRLCLLTLMNSSHPKSMIAEQYQDNFHWKIQKLLLLLCYCFTSVVNSYGHVWMVGFT